MKQNTNKKRTYPHEDEESYFGDKLTALNEKESVSFLEKYEGIIKRESFKIGEIQGMDFDDICQECRIKILSEAHMYDPEEGCSEKTWITTIIKRKLIKMKQKSMIPSKTPSIFLENGKTKPLFTFSSSSMEFEDSGERRSFEEIYNPSNFQAEGSMSSNSYSPEDLTEVKSILESLKKNLSPEIYEYIESKINPNHPVSKIIRQNEKNNRDLEREGFYKIQKPRTFTIFKRICSESVVTKFEHSIVSEIASLMVNRLGFSPKDFLERERTIGLSCEQA